jgi:hypothetical protein
MARAVAVGSVLFWFEHGEVIGRSDLFERSEDAGRSGARMVV